jgi:MazG family protein
MTDRARSERPAQPNPPDAGRPDLTSAARRFEELVKVMQTLRSPDGCPWDRAQTLESLRPFVLEEAYEVVEAIDRGDRDALRGEIGDLLFEAVFLAQLTAEDGDFTVADALEAVVGKLVRRHPHVFGRAAPAAGEEADGIRTPADVLEQWEKIKGRERLDAGERPALLAGVPRNLPALLRAFEIGNRVAAVGFDWPRAADVVAKIEEEVAELARAVAEEGRERTEEEMGDVLFSLANLARKLGVDPETALRRANDKFTKRFTALEAGLDARGLTADTATLGQMEEEWNKTKAGVRG